MSCPVTIIFIIISVILYILTEAEARRDPDRPLFNGLLLMPMMVKRGQWYRLFTSAFLHGSIQHIAMNMIALYNLGSFLEPYLGPIPYLIALLGSILGGSLFITLREDPRSRTVGMSGGIYGIMMVYFLVLFRHGLFAVDSVRMSILRTVGINLLISFMPGVSLSGHAGGSAAGILIGFLLLYVF